MPSERLPAKRNIDNCGAECPNEGSDGICVGYCPCPLWRPKKAVD